MITVGIKELKNRLSHYLREIKKGEKIAITEREKIIATITLVKTAGKDSKLLSLVKEGFAVWKGGKPTGSKHPIKVKGKTVSEIVVAQHSHNQRALSSPLRKGGHRGGYEKYLQKKKVFTK